MINIFDNFCELETTENIAVLKKLGKVDKQDVSKFTPEILEKMIHFKILSNDALQKLDHFLENTLKLFPQLFPYIILKQTQSCSNLLKRKKAFNNFIQTNVEEKITNCDSAKEIFNVYNSKKYISSTESDSFLEDINTNITFIDIENEILAMVQKKFNKQFRDAERKKLSKIITAEIYLRTLICEEYIYTEDFKLFEDACDDATDEHDTQIKEKLKLEQRKGSSKEDLCTLLQKELLK